MLNQDRPPNSSPQSKRKFRKQDQFDSIKNIGDRFYKRGLFKQMMKDKFVDEMQSVKKAKEMEGITFHPKIYSHDQSYVDFEKGIGNDT